MLSSSRYISARAANRSTLCPSTPAAPAFAFTFCQAALSVWARYTLSIRLNHFPPLTPFSSAANMRSFHTEASTHDQSLLWASAPCVATCGTPGAWLSLCFVVKLTLPPSYPPFPRSGFASRPSRGFHRSGTTGTLTPAPLTYGTGLPAFCATPSCRSVSNHVGCLVIASPTTPA